MHRATTAMTAFVIAITTITSTIYSLLNKRWITWINTKPYLGVLIMSCRNLHSFNIKRINPFRFLNKPPPNWTIPFSTITSMALSRPRRSFIPVNFTSINPPRLTTSTTDASQQSRASLFNPIQRHSFTQTRNKSKIKNPVVKIESAFESMKLYQQVLMVFEMKVHPNFFFENRPLEFEVEKIGSYWCHDWNMPKTCSFKDRVGSGQGTIM